MDERALLWDEPRGTPPDGKKDLLHDFLCGGAAQAVLGKAKDSVRRARVERSERFLATDGELEHELLVSAARRAPA
jgi:hypothetical protein